MKSLKEYIVNESILDPKNIEKLQALLLTDIDNNEFVKGHRIKVRLEGASIETEAFAKYVAGPIIEEAVKTALSSISELKDSNNDYYDFLFDDEKIEVKALLEGEVKNFKLTGPQLKEKDNMIFIIVNYSASKDTIILNNITILPGNQITTKSGSINKGIWK